MHCLSVSHRHVVDIAIACGNEQLCRRTAQPGYAGREPRLRLPVLDHLCRYVANRERLCCLFRIGFEQISNRNYTNWCQTFGCLGTDGWCVNDIIAMRKIWCGTALDTGLRLLRFGYPWFGWHDCLIACRLDR